MRSGYSFIPSSLIAAGASEDRLIDPVTLDYVDDGKGGWEETKDKRTVVLIALSTKLNRSPYHPASGTAVEERMEAGIPVDQRFREAETSRVGRALEKAGVISEFRVTTVDEQGNTLVDEQGRPVVHTQWRDPGSASAELEVKI